MTRLYLIRHAHAVENPKNTARAPLTEIGKKQAENLAKRLHGEHIHVFYVSPYQRALQTAKIITEPHLIRVFETKERLEEVDFRVKTKVSLTRFAELRNIYTREEAEQIKNLLTSQKKGLKLMRSLIDEHWGKNIALITHGNIIKAIVLAVLGAELKSFYKFKIDETSLTIIEGKERDKMIISTLNDICHLR